MSWAVLHTEDVLSEFTVAENSAIRNLLGGSGSGSASGSGSGPPFWNLDLVTVRVIDEVRGYIIAGSYAIDLIYDNTIPLGLFEDAIAIARWRILISTPLLKQLQTEDRRLAYETALKKLQLIADRKFVPESPTIDITNRDGNWNSENKLIMRTHPVPTPESQFPPTANEWANQGIQQTPIYVAGALYVSTIVSLRDDPNSLEAYPSTRFVTGTGLLIVINLSASTWQLVTGPADIGNPDGEVQPLDYNVGTNNRHWSKVGGL